MLVQPSEPITASVVVYTIEVWEYPILFCITQSGKQLLYDVRYADLTYSLFPCVTMCVTDDMLTFYSEEECVACVVPIIISDTAKFIVQSLYNRGKNEIYRG